MKTSMGFRSRIIAAARGLLAEKGYSALSVQAVLDRSGVARSTFYRHFGGIEDVLVEHVVEDIRSTLVRLIDQGDPHQGFQPRLVALLMALVESFLSVPPLGLVGPEGASIPVVKLVLSDGLKFRSACEPLFPLLVTAQIAGEMHTGLDVQDAAEWLLRNCWSLSAVPVFGRAGMPTEAYVASFVVAGLIAPPRSTPGDVLDRLSRIETRLDQLIDDTGRGRHRR